VNTVANTIYTYNFWRGHQFQISAAEFRFKSYRMMTFGRIQQTGVVPPPIPESGITLGFWGVAEINKLGVVNMRYVTRVQRYINRGQVVSDSILTYRFVGRKISSSI
jgi:hypothetical protein